MKRVFISADLRHYTCLEEMPFSMFVPFKKFIFVDQKYKSVIYFSLWSADFSVTLLA
jgi:hypothetical protein